MAATQGIKNGFLQSDLDARDFTILNFDLTGLGLTKSSVGLGNVDDTSDANKPLSIATLAALELKENAIPAGTADQFLNGDKAWQDYGALALQDGATTLPLLSVTATAADGYAVLKALRNDGLANSSLTHIGASVAGNILTGLPAANVGLLAFEGCSFGVINTLNSAPLVFGTNNTKRARIGLGLSVGSDTEAGAGCIAATGTITGILVGSGAGITGLVKNQIPGTLNATIMPRLTINGVGGAGYVQFGAQSSNPTLSGPLLFANNLGRICLQGSESANALSFGTLSLTADRIWSILNVTGTVPIIVSAPASAVATGVAGSIAYDATHLFICTATNVWRRIAHATW